MRLGASFPMQELGGDPDMIRDWAQQVERLGLSHIGALEHILGFDGYGHVSAVGPLDSHSIMHEPLVLFGYLAGMTERIELVTGVLVLPQRQTALVAKQAAEVDFLSGGRLRLGLGIGWIREEFDALNEDWTNRGRRSEEQIAVLRALGTEQPVDFAGKWHQFERAGISPLPVQQPIPIWLGTHSEAGLRRAGEFADGWMPIGRPGADLEHLRAMLGRIHAAARGAGRDPDIVGIDPQVLYNWVPESGWIDFAAQWHALGATHVTVHTLGLGTSSVDEHVGVLERLRDELSAAGLLSMF